jgi:hypothetical protein
MTLSAASYISMTSHDSANMKSTAVWDCIPFGMERIVCCSTGGIYEQYTPIDELADERWHESMLRPISR